MEDEVILFSALGVICVLIASFRVLNFIINISRMVQGQRQKISAGIQMMILVVLGVMWRIEVMN